MAEATSAVGVNGDVTLPTGHNIKVDRFGLTIGQRMVNTTGFGDTFEVNTGGLKYGQGSATGCFEYGAASTAPGAADIEQAGGSATFQIATGCTYAGTIVITQLDIAADVNGETRGTFNFLTSGALTETWDEGST